MANPSKSQLVGIATLVVTHLIARGVLYNKQATRELDEVQVTNMVKERISQQIGNVVANATTTTR